MKCTEFERALEQDGLAADSQAAQTHLAGCDACQSLLADFTAIAAAARALPAEAEPPQRLWLSLRAQLAAEGILQETAPPRESFWWHSLAALFQSHALATAAVGLLLVAGAAVQLRRTPPPSAAEPLPYAETAAMLQQQERGVAGMALAGTTASPVDASLRENLRILDQFIADCEQRVRQDPTDDVAREYLSGAYQQKAELLAAMMDRSGSGDY
ncbi:MAG: hypothetical protein LAN84_03010 [Acidobacteriia bacterium]|nr:hypothetical protein [Terriglobia bacterium]